MNKTVKTILIIAACLIPVGLIITGLGIFMGAKGGWTFRYIDGKATTSSDVVDKTVELKDFDSLDLEISSVDCTIMRGDRFAIKYKVRSGEEPEIKEDGGKLKVKQPLKGLVMFEFGGMAEELDEYTITVPEGHSVDMDIKTSSGDVTIDRVNADISIIASSGDILLNDVEGSKLDVVLSSGDINGDKVKVSKVGFKASSGDVSMLRLSADEVDCKTSSGDIELYDSEASKITCAASSGEIKIELNGNPDDYAYIVNTNSGDITVNGEEYEKDVEIGKGKDKKIELSATSGEVEVDIN